MGVVVLSLPTERARKTLFADISLSFELVDLIECFHALKLLFYHRSGNHLCIVNLCLVISLWALVPNL